MCVSRVSLRYNLNNNSNVDLRLLTRPKHTRTSTCQWTTSELWLHFCVRLQSRAARLCLLWNNSSAAGRDGTGRDGTGREDERRRLGSSEVLSLQRSRRATRRFIWRFKINYVTPQDRRLFCFICFDMELVLHF